MIMMVSNYNVTDEQTLLEKAQALDVVSAIFVLIIDIMFPICLYNYCHQSLCLMFSVYLSVFRPTRLYMYAWTIWGFLYKSICKSHVY